MWDVWTANHFHYRERGFKVYLSLIQVFFLGVHLEKLFNIFYMLVKNQILYVHEHMSLVNGRQP